MPEPEKASHSDIARALARAWCAGTERQARRFREASTNFTSKSKAWRREEGAHSEEEVIAAAEAQWTEAHLLVIATGQMTKWAAKALEDDGQPALENLQDLRNTVEHLDEAEINAARGEALANPEIRHPQSINKLPGKALALSVSGGLDGLYVFGVTHVAAIEFHCRMVRESNFRAAEPKRGG